MNSKNEHTREITLSAHLADNQQQAVQSSASSAKEDWTWDADDELVRKFLSDHSRPVGDGGFTMRLMLHLPDILYYTMEVLKYVACIFLLYGMFRFVDFSQLNQITHLFNHFTELASLQ